MRWAAELRERFRTFLHRAGEEAAMDEEMAFHLEMETRRNVESGMRPEEARRKALIAFGGVEAHREAVRDARGWPFVEAVWRDTGYAARWLRRSPGFTVVTVVTLGLGIGSSVAMFGTTRLATQPIAFADPARLFSVSVVNDRGFGRNPTLEEFEAWEQAVAGRASLGAFASGSRSVGDASGTTYAYGVRVTPEFFRVLGAAPVVGRTLQPEDFQPGSPPVAVISSRLWRGRFAGDPGVAGRTVELDGRAHTVTGVLPAGSQFPAPVDVWTPLVAGPEVEVGTFVTVIGRRVDDARMDDVVTVLGLTHEAFSADRSTASGRIEPGPLMGRVAPESDIAMMVLRGIVLVLLLIGVTNAAGMILSRSVERGRETAVRASLGASRGRLFRQFATETGLLAAIAGGLGLAIAYTILALMRAWVPEDVAEQILGWEGLGIDAYAVAVALVLSIAVALGCGVWPAWRTSRRDPSVGLGRGAYGASAERQSGRLSRLLVAGQVAAALTLLLVAGLLARNFTQLLRLPPGFDAAGIVTVEWELPPDRFVQGEGEIISRFQVPLVERLSAEAGVEPIGFVTAPPMNRLGPTSRYRSAASDTTVEARAAAWRAISPGYLIGMGIPLLRGRGFSEVDRLESARVAIVSESLARREWPDGADPIGRSLVIEGRGDAPWTIVGVTADVRGAGIGGRAEPTIYAPLAQAPFTRGFLVLRVDEAVTDFAPAIQRAIWSIDGDIVIGPILTFRQTLRDLFASEMALAAMTGFFAILALTITIHSLLALVVRATFRRRREIGIRMALGATAGRIVRQNILSVMRWVMLGTIGGVGLSAALSQLLASLLVGIDPLDPFVFAVVPLTVLGAGSLACWIPARRAARLDPVATLRSD